MSEPPGGLLGRRDALAVIGTTLMPLLVPTAVPFEVVEGLSSPAGLAPAVRTPTRGQAAITFDDGPHRTTTDKVLDVLRRRGAPATFFMVGTSAAGLPAVVRRVVKAGHSVQVHGWNHARLDTKSTSAVASDLRRTRDTLATMAGRRPTAFRPPYGYTNARVRTAASGIGLRQVMWNATPSVRFSSSAQGLSQIMYWVDSLRRRGKGATILLHDGSGPRAATVALLSPLITELRRDGWQLVRLT